MSRVDQKTATSGAALRARGRASGRSMEEILSSIRRLMAEAPEDAPSIVRLSLHPDNPAERGADSTRARAEDIQGHGGQDPSVAGAIRQDIQEDVLELDETLIADVGDSVDLDGLADAMLDAVRTMPGGERSRGGRDAASETAETLDAGGWVELEDLLSVAEETFGPTAREPAETEAEAPSGVLPEAEPKSGLELPPIIAAASAAPENSEPDLAAAPQPPAEAPEEPEAPTPTRGDPTLFHQADLLSGDAETAPAIEPGLESESGTEPGAPAGDLASDLSPEFDPGAAGLTSPAQVEAVEAAWAGAAVEDEADEDEADPALDSEPESSPVEAQEPEGSSEEQTASAPEPYWPGDALDDATAKLQTRLGQSAEEAEAEEEPADEPETAPASAAAPGAAAETADTQPSTPPAEPEPTPRPEPAAARPRDPLPHVGAASDPRNGPSNDDLRQLSSARSRLTKILGERMRRERGAGRAPNEAVTTRVGRYDPSNRAPRAELPVRPMPEFDGIVPPEEAVPDDGAVESGPQERASIQSRSVQRALEILESGETPRDLDVTPGPGPGGRERAAMRAAMEEILRESLEPLLEDLLRRRAARDGDS